METIKHALRQSQQLLKEDVSMFRQLVLKSEGGNLPPDILEKQALVKDIEAALTRLSQLGRGDAIGNAIA